MDQLIENLKATILQETTPGSTINTDKLAEITSSLKDLTIIRLIEELRTGKLRVRQEWESWYLENRT